MDLVFVYNAKSNLPNKVFDFAHKIISPSTYQCSLCKLTHNDIAERSSWKDFIKKTEHSIEVLHIDEFENKYNISFNYPVILKKLEGQLHEVVSGSKLSELEDTSALITHLSQLE